MWMLQVDVPMRKTDYGVVNLREFYMNVMYISNHKAVAQGYSIIDKFA